MEQTNKKINLTSAVILSLNAMIGAGIFTVPVKFAISVGPAGIITYLGVLLSVLFMALSIAKVAQIVPSENSFYSYVSSWAGKTWGQITLISYIVGITIAMGLVLKMLSQEIYFSYGAALKSEALTAAIIISLITIINIFSIKLVKALQSVLLIFTLFAIFSTTIICFLNGQVSNLQPFVAHGWLSVLTAAPIIIFAFFGFEATSSLADRIENPNKNVPKSIAYSVFLVGIIYFLFILSINLAIPASSFSSEKDLLTQILPIKLPKYVFLTKAISIAIKTSLLGVLQSMVYSVAALLAKSLNLFGIYNVNKQNAHILLSIAILIVALTFKNLGLFFNLTAIFVVFAYAMSIAKLMFIEYKSKFDKLLPILGLTTSGLIFLSAIIGLIK